MAWTIEIDPAAQKELRKLDVQIARGVVKFLFERVALLENPRSIGEALQGDKLGSFWKYRVGDYRIICSLEDHRLIVSVVRIGHRRETYK